MAERLRIIVLNIAAVFANIFVYTARSTVSRLGVLSVQQIVVAESGSKLLTANGTSLSILTISSSAGSMAQSGDHSLLNDVQTALITMDTVGQTGSRTGCIIALKCNGLGNMGFLLNNRPVSVSAVYTSLNLFTVGITGRSTEGNHFQVLAFDLLVDVQLVTKSTVIADPALVVSISRVITGREQGVIVFGVNSILHDVCSVSKRMLAVLALFSLNTVQVAVVVGAVTYPGGGGQAVAFAGASPIAPLVTVCRNDGIDIDVTASLTSVRGVTVILAGGIGNNRVIVMTERRQIDTADLLRASPAVPSDFAGLGAGGSLGQNFILGVAERLLHIISVGVATYGASIGGVACRRAGGVSLNSLILVAGSRKGLLGVVIAVYALLIVSPAGLGAGRSLAGNDFAQSMLDHFDLDILVLVAMFALEAHNAVLGASGFLHNVVSVFSTKVVGSNSVYGAFFNPAADISGVHAVVCTGQPVNGNFTALGIGGAGVQNPLEAVAGNPMLANPETSFFLLRTVEINNDVRLRLQNLLVLSYAASRASLNILTVNLAGGLYGRGHKVVSKSGLDVSDILCVTLNAIIPGVAIFGTGGINNSSLVVTQLNPIMIAAVRANIRGSSTRSGCQSTEGTKYHQDSKHHGHESSEIDFHGFFLL